jgi:adenylosuccinate lyase
LLALVGKGFTREEAYTIVQRNALRAWKNELSFKQLLLEDAKLSKKMSREEIDDCFDLAYHLKNVDYIFRRAGIL